MKHESNQILDDLGHYLNELVEQSRDVFWIMDKNYSKQLYLSPAFEQIWGLSKESLYKTTKKWINTIHPEDKRRLLYDIRKRNPKVAMAQKFWQSYRIVRPDGEVRWVEDESFAIFDDQGLHIGFAGIVRDITEKKNRELFLEKVLEEAKAVNKRKTEFIENISHDIKTPISNLVGMSSILASKLQDVNLKEIAIDLQKTAAQLLDFTNEIIEFTRIDDDHPQNTFFNIREVVNDVLDLLMQEIKEKKIEFHFNYSKKIASNLYSDRSHVFKIILNLLSNAIKFTDQKGKVFLKILLKKQQENLQIIEICVKDTGIGIPEESREIIFERYTRLNPAYEGKYKGSGIGLHIVKKLVDNLQGHITVKSTVGKGSTFSVILPLQSGVEEFDDNKDKNKIVSKEDSLKTKYLLKNKKILLVEDNDIARKIAENMLTIEGAYIESVNLGKEALRRIKKKNYDLLIIDIGLPDISGYEIAEKIRNYQTKNKKQPTLIIALTAHVRKKDLMLCKEYGIDKALSKPLNVHILKDCLFKLDISKDSKLNSRLNQDLKKLPAIDLELGAALIGGDIKKAKAMLKQLIKILPEDLKKIQTAHLEQNFAELKDLAHYINGGASYCGTPRLKFLSERLYKCIGDNGDRQTIDHAFHELCAEIQNLFDEYKNLSS